jgi:hypothetical protein
MNFVLNWQLMHSLMSNPWYCYGYLFATGFAAVIFSFFGQPTTHWGLALYTAAVLLVVISFLSRVQRPILFELCKTFEYIFLIANLVVYVIAFSLQMVRNRSSLYPDVPQEIAVVQGSIHLGMVSRWCFQVKTIQFFHDRVRVCAVRSGLWTFALFCGLSYDAVYIINTNAARFALTVLVANGLYLIFHYKFLTSADAVRALPVQLLGWRVDTNSIAQSSLLTMIAFLARSCYRAWTDSLHFVVFKGAISASTDELGEVELSDADVPLRSARIQSWLRMFFPEQLAGKSFCQDDTPRTNIEVPTGSFRCLCWFGAMCSICFLLQLAS